MFFLILFIIGFFLFCPLLFLKNNFIFGCIESLLSHGLFLSCREEGLSLVVVCGLLVAEHRLCGALAVVVAARGLSSCNSQALEHRLDGCGAWAYLLCSLWDLPGSAVEPRTPALTGRFFTSEPPGKPCPFQPLFCLARSIDIYQNFNFQSCLLSLLFHYLLVR